MLDSIQQKSGLFFLFKPEVPEVSVVFKKQIHDFTSSIVVIMVSIFSTPITFNCFKMELQHDSKVNV